MNYNFLRGTGVALVTPFNESGTVDVDGLKKLVNHVINGGVEYLVVLGTTGESATLDKQEKQLVMSTIKEHNAGRVPMVCGIGGNNTAEIANSLQNTDLDGFSAILSVSPYYNKPTQEGIYQHYMTLDAVTPLPIILYNVPGRTSSNMTAETTLRLANDANNIVAMKEASGDLEQCIHIIRQKPEGFYVVSGDDALTLPFVASGGDGVISVIGNAFPEQFSGMVRAALAGNMDEARSLNNEVYAIIPQLFIEGNPGGVKVCLDELGVCANTVRLPLWPVSKGTEATLRQMTQATMKMPAS